MFCEWLSKFLQLLTHLRFELSNFNTILEYSAPADIISFTAYSFDWHFKSNTAYSADEETSKVPAHYFGLVSTQHSFLDNDPTLVLTVYYKF